MSLILILFYCVTKIRRKKIPFYILSLALLIFIIINVRDFKRQPSNVGVLRFRML